MQPLKKAGVDTVVLGCTHYPLLKPMLKKVLGPEVALIDSAKQVAIEVKKILAADGELNCGAKTGRNRFYVSDNPQWFSSLAKRFLGKKVDDVSKAVTF